MISLIGYLIYPNFLFQLGYFGVFLISVLFTPILYMWFFYREFKYKKNKIQKIVISIYAGILVSFIFHLIVTVNLSNKYWNKTAIETEVILRSYKIKNGYYPENLSEIPDSVISNKNFIFKRRFRLMQINVSDNNKTVTISNEEYVLTTGFWSANLRTWNPSEKKWIYKF